jgi:hypothetical protein
MAMKPRPVDIAAVENLDRGPGVDHGLDDPQAVPHRARRPVPFGNHKLVAGVEVIEGAGKLRASGHALAGCGVGIDHAASETFERLGLPREVLLLRAYARVADEAFSGLTFETHL